MDYNSSKSAPANEEQAYLCAKNKMQTAKTYEDFYQAAEYFRKIPNYKDSYSLQTECIFMGNKMRDEEIALCEKEISRCNKSLSRKGKKIFRNFIDTQNNTYKKKLEKSKTIKLISIFATLIIVHLIIQFYLLFNQKEIFTFEQTAAMVMLLTVITYVYLNVSGFINKIKTNKANEKILDQYIPEKLISKDIKIIKQHNYWTQRLHKAKSTHPYMEI